MEVSARLRRSPRARDLPQARVRFAVVLTVLLGLLRELRLGAEDHVDSKFEYYAEERGRVQVRTLSTLFEQALTPWLSLKGSVIYDGISGATPTGGPVLTGGTGVPLARLQDDRYAAFLEPSFRWGRQTFQPQFAYSIENDYESIGTTLNYLLDFNQRNTTLHAGITHNFDTLTGGIYLGPRPRQKESTDFLLGLTQTLTPTTLFNATVTFGRADGYLSDPYKGFRFTEYPVEEALFPERRPSHRTKQIFSTSLTQFVGPLDGSAELTYRFYHDSFGLIGHTATLEWFQNVGRRLVLVPLFRYYEQSAADFYLLSFDADPSDRDNPNNALVPAHYSSDDRLSSLRTFTYGLSARVKIRNRLFFEAAYQRYEMAGLDGVTPSSSFPCANIYTMGLRLHF